MVKAILEKSGHETEFVKLTELTYSACRGCVQLCAPHQVCRHEDDLFPYYQKLKEADAVVLGSAVYFGTVNAGMLSFVERFFGYRHVDVVIRGKPFVLALTGGELDGAAEHFQRTLMPFAVKIWDVVQYKSGIPPCFSCGRHQECSIGGLYGAMGKAAHSLTITPELFHRWEDHPKTVMAVEAAAAKLASLQPGKTQTAESLVSG
jgi:hypothetical protein